ncbi:hypothetical protein QUD52_13660 [Lactococcus lactis]|uniref:Uncharacterized protein n=1 Tax=Lactococcus lactis TaxID=1358 RepID=A0AAW7J0K6_9LACT|nr:hypothetical protein [Lactococcus lactis]MDM7548028.1 hypothetical protein [Lactococcus lactis]
MNKTTTRKRPERQPDKFDITRLPQHIQPQLTIPKSIAEQADKTDLDTLFKWGQQEFYQWFNHEQDEFMPVIYTYLASRALGVDLVKVVEGIDDNY